MRKHTVKRERLSGLLCSATIHAPLNTEGGIARDNNPLVGIRPISVGVGEFMTSAVGYLSFVLRVAETHLTHKTGGKDSTIQHLVF